MVLPEFEEPQPSPDNPGEIDSSPRSYYSPEYGEAIGHEFHGSVPTGPGGTWTVENIKKLYEQRRVYPYPFTKLPFYARIQGWKEKDRDELIAANVNRTQLYVDRQLDPVEVQAESHYNSLLHQSLYKSEFLGLLSFLGLAALRQQAKRPGFLTPYINKLMGNELGKWYIRLCRYGIYGFFGRLQGGLIGTIIGANKVKELMRHDPNVQRLAKDLSEVRQWTAEEIKHRLKERKAGGPSRPLLPTAEEIRSAHRQNSIPKPTEVGHDEGHAIQFGDNGHEDIVAKGANVMTKNSAVNSVYYHDSEDVFEDGVSPISPDSPRVQRRSTFQNTPGESSWDRLRRKAVTSQDPKQSGYDSSESESVWARLRQVRADQPTSALKTDSYTYSSSDVEKAFVKEEAQKEFDGRLEKERKGMSGESWSKASTGTENLSEVDSRRRW